MFAQTLAERFGELQRELLAAYRSDLALLLKQHEAKQVDVGAQAAPTAISGCRSPLASLSPAEIVQGAATPWVSPRTPTEIRPLCNNPVNGCPVPRPVVQGGPLLEENYIGHVSETLRAVPPPKRLVGKPVRPSVDRNVATAWAVLAESEETPRSDLKAPVINPVPAHIGLDLPLQNVEKDSSPMSRTATNDSTRVGSSTGTGLRSNKAVNFRSFTSDVNLGDLEGEETGSSSAQVTPTASHLHKKISTVSEASMHSGMSGGSSVDLGEMWPAWVRDSSTFEESPSGAKGPRHTGVSSFTNKALSEPSWMAGQSARIGDILQTEGMMRRCMVSPESWKRMIWLVLASMLISFDVIYIPWSLSFSLHEAQAIQFMSTVAPGLTCFWIVDVCFTFFVGFHRDGTLEMRPRMVASHYFKTWFFLDVTIVVVDSIFTFMNLGSGSQSNADIATLGRAYRSFRVLRLVKLVRLTKVTESIKFIADLLRSDVFAMIANIMKLAFLILILNHFLACGWHAIAEYNGVDEKTWLNVYNLEDGTPGYRYACALHWSLTQFTPATNNIAPENFRERCFAIGTVIFAMMTFSSFVSTMTAMTNQIREYNRQKSLEESKIREYLCSHQISWVVGQRIWHFFRQKYKLQTRRLLLNDIEFFREMPASLSIEFHAEVYKPHLRKHPLFGILMDRGDVTVVQSICCRAMTEKFFKPGQELFLEADPAEDMLFLISGSLAYSTEAHLYTVNPDDGEICEAALWIRWVHVGNLTSVTESDLVSLNASRVMAVVSSRRIRSDCQWVLEALREYAMLFAEAATSQDSRVFARGCTRMTDLGLPDYDVQEMAKTAAEVIKTDSVPRPPTHMMRAKGSQFFGGRFGRGHTARWWHALTTSLS